MSGQHPAGDPGGTGLAGLAGEVTAAAARCEEAVAALVAGTPGGVREALAVLAVMRDLQAQVAGLAWDAELARQVADREFWRGYAEGYAARRRVAARRGPRPPWPRPAT